MSDGKATSAPSEEEIRKRFEMGKGMSQGKLGNRLSLVHAGFYRMMGGRKGARINDALGDRPVLLLTTVGRKSGKQRTVPLIYLDDGDARVVVGSNAGQATDPAWIHNLRAQPMGSVQVGKDRIPVVAEILSDQAAAELWPRLNRMYRGYEFYAEMTDRTQQVVRLRPVGQA